MKVLLRTVLVLSILIINAGIKAQEPVLMDGWPREYPNVLSPLNFFDINGDGFLEILFGLSDQIHCIDYSGDIISGWPFEHDGAYFKFAPVIGDIDGDGRAEIVAYDSHGEIIALEPGGSLCAGFPIEVGENNDVPHLTLYDIDGDGAMEIIGGRGTSNPDTVWQVFALTGNGQFSEGWPINGIYASEGIAVGDIDNDGSPDIVIAGEDESGNDLFAFNFDGSIKDGFPVNFADDVDICMPCGPPALFDRNGDNYLEIAQVFIIVNMYPYHRFCSIALLDHRGSMINPWPLQYGEISQGGLSIGFNLTNQEYYFAFGKSFGYLFYLADMNAQMVPGWPVFVGDRYFGTYHQPTIADVDGDGSIDYLFNYDYYQADSGRIWGFSHQGEPLEYFPLRMPGKTSADGIFAGDIDNDGIVEIVTENFGTVPPRPPKMIFMFKLDGVSYNPELSPWPMRNHDPQQTNNFNFRMPTSVSEEKTVIPATVTLNNHPNPFNSSTIIEYSVEAKSEVKLEIFNIFGQRVAKLVDAEIPPGVYSTLWSADEFSSGIYFSVLNSEKEHLCRKMVLIK